MSEPKAAENGRRTAGTVPDWAVVDLFCGIGGLSHGFRQAGFQVVAGVDADETCRYAYETNNDAKFVGRPLEDVTGAEIRSMFPEGSGRILIGCAPCTPFSAYASGSKSRSDKWSLVDLFMERIREVEPEIVSMENVTRLISFDRGRVFHRFVEGLEAPATKSRRNQLTPSPMASRSTVAAWLFSHPAWVRLAFPPQTSRRLEPFATQSAIFRRSEQAKPIPPIEYTVPPTSRPSISDASELPNQASRGPTGRTPH